MFNFIYYNNIIFLCSNHIVILFVLPMNTTQTTAIKTDNILISTFGSFKIDPFYYI
jgi:hypothetical protein